MSDQRPSAYEQHRKLHEELRSRLDTNRTWIDRVASFLTEQFGTMWFLSLNAVFFFAWIAANELGISEFDPFPYQFLTLVVSLEAIFLSIIVLVSQNRQGRIAELRDKIDFEVNVRAEEETTKSLIMLELVAKHLGVALADDAELKHLEKRTNLEEIRKRIEHDTSA